MFLGTQHDKQPSISRMWYRGVSVVPCAHGRPSNWAQPWRSLTRASVPWIPVTPPARSWSGHYSRLKKRPATFFLRGSIGYAIGGRTNRHVDVV